MLFRSLLQKLPLPPVPHGTEGLIETIWLLLTSVAAVPLICKLPGGSPVLGFLVSICGCLCKLAHVDCNTGVRILSRYVGVCVLSQKCGSVQLHMYANQYCSAWVGYCLFDSYGDRHVLHYR